MIEYVWKTTDVMYKNNSNSKLSKNNNSKIEHIRSFKKDDVRRQKIYPSAFLKSLSESIEQRKIFESKNDELISHTLLLDNFSWK